MECVCVCVCVCLHMGDADHVQGMAVTHNSKHTHTNKTHNTQTNTQQTHAPLRRTMPLQVSSRYCLLLLPAAASGGTCDSGVSPTCSHSGTHTHMLLSARMQSPAPCRHTHEHAHMQHKHTHMLHARPISWLQPAKWPSSPPAGQPCSQPAHLVSAKRHVELGQLCHAVVGHLRRLMVVWRAVWWSAVWCVGAS
jgi:hypothetical protein